jgi:hypothetical protein
VQAGAKHTVEVCDGLHRIVLPDNFLAEARFEFPRLLTLHCWV